MAKSDQRQTDQTTKAEVEAAKDAVGDALGQIGVHINGQPVDEL